MFKKSQVPSHLHTFHNALLSAHLPGPSSLLLISNTSDDKEGESGNMWPEQVLVSLLCSIGHTCGVQGQLSSGGPLGCVAVTSIIRYGTEQRPKDHLPPEHSRVRTRHFKMPSGKNLDLDTWRFWEGKGKANICLHVGPLCAEELMKQWAVLPLPLMPR